MEDGKKVLKYCPNYYYIIEFNPLKEDQVTKNVIRMYREYIFSVDISNPSGVEKITNLDGAVAKYLNDYSFRREAQKLMAKLNTKKEYKETVRDFVNTIIKLYVNYQDYTTRVIYISRWI